MRCQSSRVLLNLQVIAGPNVRFGSSGDFQIDVLTEVWDSL